MDIEKLKRKDLAFIFSVDPRTVTRWYQDGMPRNRDNSYDLRAAIKWREEKLSEMTSAAETEESVRWLTAFRKERAKHARLERLKAEGNLISKEQVLEQWVWRMSEIANFLSQWPMRLMNLLEGKTKHEIRAIVDTEQRRARENFCREGRFCPLGDEPKRGKKYAGNKKSAFRDR